MRYAKHAAGAVAAAFLCAWCGAEAPTEIPPVQANPVTLAKQATGLAFRPKVETIPGGEINWTRGVVCAVGIGKAREDLTGRQAELMAKRGAVIVAARNAALVLAGIRVGPGGRFENVRNGWIRADVTLSGFRELGATYNPTTRTATARMEIPLSGVRGAVNVLGLEQDKPKRRWTWPDGSDKNISYDVIVIDVRGLSCKPGVLPRIATTDGQCVFDATDTLTGGSLKHLAARYVTLSRKTAIPEKADRNHRRCLAVKASRIDENGAIVLDQRNLEILTQVSGTKQTLRKGRLLIVADE